MKVVKITSIVSGAMVAVGIVVAVLGYALGGKVGLFTKDDMGRISFGTNELVQVIEEVSDFKNIDIDADFDYVELIKSDKNKIELNYTKLFGDITAKVENDTLTISQKRQNTFGIAVNNNKTYAKIYIKDSESLNDIKASIDNAEVSINDFKIDNLTLNCDYGEVDLRNCTFNNLVINADNGDVKVENINTRGNSEINNRYGDVEIKNSQINSLKVIADNGQISIDKCNINNASFEDSYGEVAVDNTTILNGLIAKLDNGDFEANGSFEGNIKIENRYGDTELNIKTDKTYNRYITNEYGDIKIDNKESSGSVISENNGEYSLIIDSDNGDVEVNFLQ